MKSTRRILSLLALVLAFGVLFSMTVLPAFADAADGDDNTNSSDTDKSETEGDTGSEGGSDDNGTDSGDGDKAEDTEGDDTKEDTSKDDTTKDDSSKDETKDDSSDDKTDDEKEETAFQKWWNKYNQMIGYIVAGVVFVACSFGVYLWIKSALNSDKNKGKKPARSRNKQ